MERIFLFVASLSMVVLMTACGGGSQATPIPTPPHKVGEPNGSVTLYVNNPQANPVTVTFATTCYYDQPPWTYTVLQGQTISFGISVNDSGSCFFEKSTGQIYISAQNFSDVVNFEFDFLASGNIINCGSGTGEVRITNTWTYIYPGTSCIDN